MHLTGFLRMRQFQFCGKVLFFLAMAASSPGQMTNEASQVQSSSASTNAAPVTAGPQPLPALTIGDKTFENVTLTGFNGNLVVFSHAVGVKDIPVSQLTPDQIDALNKTSEKIKIVPPAPAPATNSAPAAVPTTNAAPAAAAQTATNAPPETAESPPVPADDPAVIAKAAAATETMTQDFRSLGRSGQESDQGERARTKVPGIVRFLVWAGSFAMLIGQGWLIGTAIHETDSMTWALLIFFFNPISGLIYGILHIRTAAVPYGLYVAGFLMLAIPILHYRMGFFDLLM